jgi:putative SOS response-associated peptidase YedK
MCGRYLNRTPASETARIFGTAGVVPNYPPRYNLAPTQPVLAVRFDPDEGVRRLETLRWGLIPSWAKDAKIGAKCINAQAETVADRPAFRDAFRRRRCLLPTDGFYEWQRIGKERIPHAIVPADGMFAFAGLWERWTDPASGEAVRSCTILTGPPNAAVAPIHGRMPVILPPEAWPFWLGEAPAGRDELLALLQPHPAERMRVYRVGTGVNNVRNDEPLLAEPA